MIKEITLNNFKCFGRLSRRCSDLTVLAGNNGIGKSSVVQALLLVRQTLINKRAESNILTLDGEFVNLVSANNVLYADAQSDEFSITIYDSQCDEDLVLTVPVAGRDTKDPLFTLNGGKGAENIPLLNQDFLYIYANRESPSEEYLRSSATAVCGRLGNKNANYAAFRLMESLDRNEKLPVAGMKHKKAKSDYVSENVSRHMSEIMGDDLDLSADGDMAAGRVKLVYREHGTPISPVNMAFGDSYLFPVVLGVLTAPEGSLMVIENPEAHLHPKAQFRMGLFLARAAQNGVQIFVETHSDHLINGIRVAAKRGDISNDKVLIQFFYRNGTLHDADEVTVNPDGSLSGWPDGFFDEWEMALKELTES